jgi:hypothetical protein
VPIRHTDARLALAVGGRWFPGVHERARIQVSASDAHVRWASAPVRDAGRGDLGVRVAVSIPAGAPAHGACDPVGATCLAATIGLSPDRRGVLEAVRMDPAHRNAREVVVEDLDSAFIAGFATATMSTSYLMRDADVVWTRVRPLHTPPAAAVPVAP